MNKSFTASLSALIALAAIACGRKGAALTEVRYSTLPPVMSAMGEAQPGTSTDRQMGSFIPAKGFVPDEQTAISIAVAVWSPIYGKERIESQKPFKARLKDGVWTVTGTLPEGYHGGTAVAEISQENGCILMVTHGQ